jgi:hypothetical protein
MGLLGEGPSRAFSRLHSVSARTFHTADDPVSEAK